MKTERNSRRIAVVERGFTLIELLVVIALVTLGVVFWHYATKPVLPTDVVTCYFPDQSWSKGITRARCDEEIGQMQQDKEKKQGALPKGCFAHKYWYETSACHDKREYEWIGEKWIETDSSKKCAPYYEKTVGEMPLRCLEYFNLKP